jgi:tuberous sclerosis protein 2
MAEIIRGNAPGSPSAATPSSSKMDRTSTSGIWSGASPSQRRKEVLIDPSFIAQQYFTYPEQSDFLPRLVVNPANIKSINGLDENYSVIDKHDVGVLYVGPGQTTASEIFSNVDGSQNYTRFVHGLGRVVKLAGQKDIPFLYKDGIFGEYSYAWWDDIQVICFHVATLMPNLPDYPKFDNKMEPIGNSFVRIVFNDSGRDYTFDTIKSDFLYCNIVISPHSKGTSRTHDDPDEHNFFKVTVQRRDGLPEFGPVGQFKVSRHTPLSIPSFLLLSFCESIRFQLAD